MEQTIFRTYSAHGHLPCKSDKSNEVHFVSGPIEVFLMYLNRDWMATVSN